MPDPSTSGHEPRSGPLAGTRVLEVAGIGPGPFAGMVLAGLGAEVIRIDRADAVPPAEAEGPARDASPYDVLGRDRRSVAVDLKQPEGAEVVLRLAEGADALYEGFRPGVAERLGIGPEACLDRNPRLVYGRMTGYGQEGPLAQRAGHDITYLATAGALAHIGRAGQLPAPPLNLVADFGGGGMLLVVGLLAGLLSVRSGGPGHVVDAAMVDGTSLLLAPFHGARAFGFWSDERGTNLLDSGAPYYDVYRCGDGRELAVGAIEPAFYGELVRGLGLDAGELPDRDDRTSWPQLRATFEQRFATRPRDEWLEVFAGTDACVAPVHTMGEAVDDPHLRARSAFVDVAGVPHPAPAPRFSEHEPAAPAPAPLPGDDTDAVLVAAGLHPDEIARLRASGAVA